MTKILLIEDDKEIGELLSEHLNGYSMEVVCADKPSEAFEALKKEKFDLVLHSFVIVDLMIHQ